MAEKSILISFLCARSTQKLVEIHNTRISSWEPLVKVIKQNIFKFV